MHTIYEINEEEIVGDDWTNSAQETLLVWGKEASEFAEQHEKAAVKAKAMRDIIIFPVIFFASATTVVIAFSDISDESAFRYAALVMSGLTAFMTALNTHLKPAEKFMLHAAAANEYRSLIKDIDYMTSLHPSKRPDVEVPFTALTNRFDNISRIAPFYSPTKKKRDPKFFDP
jgi:hypothetical protein